METADDEDPARSHPETTQGQGRTLPIDHLRATLILLVVAHHAILAYISYAPSPEAAWGAQPMAWRAFPIVDTARASFLDLLVAFNDTVLMALLFCLAGLFTWRALQRKGATGFLRGRLLRLGLPFAFCSMALAPLAYYPSYLQHGGEPGLEAYAGAWLSLSAWPSGPAWFLWVLLAFSALAAFSYRLAPGWGNALGVRLGPLTRRPWALYGVWVAASVAVYLPMARMFPPSSWFELGPFAAQTSRIPLYALYFVFGIGLGAHGVHSGWLSRRSRLARQWGIWQGMATVGLVVLLVCVIAGLIQRGKGTLHPALPAATSIAFTLSCAASSFMLLSFFSRFGHWTGRLWQSLGRNSFGIYLVHYVFVTWLQLAVLEIPAPAVVKAGAVFFAAAALSWGSSAVLRRIPGVARVI